MNDACAASSPSARRMTDTCKDLYIIATAHVPAALTKAFAGTSHGFCGAELAPPETVEEYEEEVRAFGDGAWLQDEL